MRWRRWGTLAIASASLIEAGCLFPVGVSGGGVTRALLPRADLPDPEWGAEVVCDSGLIVAGAGGIMTDGGTDLTVAHVGFDLGPLLQSFGSGVKGNGAGEIWPCGTGWSFSFCLFAGYWTWPDAPSGSGFLRGGSIGFFYAPRDKPVVLRITHDVLHLDDIKQDEGGEIWRVSVSCTYVFGQAAAGASGEKRPGNAWTEGKGGAVTP
jgi:hypothetical protein